MNKPDVKKLVLLNLPYVFAFYFADKIAAVFRLAPGTEFIDKLTNGFAVFGTAFANPLPSFHPVDLLIGLSAGVLLKLAVYVKGKNRKKFRQGEEYGSARWGKPEDIKPYTDPEFSNNVILTQTEFLTMNSRPKQPKYARNKNILVIGGSGSGKTRFFVKPNLMQMHSSYVVTDPKGTVLVECGKMLLKNGYKVKVLNTINFKKSMHYNPFAYIRSEKDILKLVNTIILNTKGEGQQSGEDFWVKAEKLYYTALIGYIWYECVEEEQNFTTLLDMINASEAREDDEEFKNPVDLMFDELEEREPDHFAVKQDFCLLPERISAFAFTLCVCHECRCQLQNVLFAVQIGKRVIVHGLVEIDRVEYLNPIVCMHKSISDLKQGRTFRVSEHIGTVKL